MQEMRQGAALTPATRLIAAASFIILGLVITIICALNQPYSGLRLTGQNDTILIEQSRHTAMALPAQLVSLQVGNNPPLFLSKDDLVEDPHFLPSYAAMQQLFDRQSRLHQQLKQHDSMTVAVQAKPDAPVTYYMVPIASSRPLSSLPVVFWFQLAVSSIGFLLGCWIWALRPQDIAARVFALLNAMYPVFAFSAAIYSTRDLALDGQLLHALTILNTAGALLYGSALVSLFLVYPKVLVKPVWLWLIPAFFIVWLLADSFYLLPEPSMGGDLPVTLQMLTAILLAFWQWRVNRGNPRARAALRWFAACILVSCGLFVFLVQTIQLLNMESSLSQGYAFGFFLLVTIGIATGLKRYRLFDLDQWAFGILFWLAGVILLIALDALLIMILSPVMSLSIALLICGLLWLPIRGVLQRRFLIKRKLPQEELFQAVLDISFANSGQNRSQQWQQLLHQLFQPLGIEEVADTETLAAQLSHQTQNNSMSQASTTQPFIAADGLILLLPSIGDIPSLRVQYPNQGRSLFSSQDSSLVRHLITLIQRADDSRFEYDRGASEERSRIARDLHDDIGSRLLSGLYQQDLQQTKQVIRQSIADMRSIISGMTGAGVTLDAALQSLQQETAQRLQDSGIILHWSISLEDGDIPLSYQTYKNYISTLRELVSNMIKYAQATQVSIDIVGTQRILTTNIYDNGTGFDLNKVCADSSHGNGVSNLKQRLQALHGTLEVISESQLRDSIDTQQGTRLCICIPLA